MDAPKIIYLQVSEDTALQEEIDWNHEETTWCSDQINDTDVEYLRMDLVEKMVGMIWSNIVDILQEKIE